MQPAHCRALLILALLLPAVLLTPAAPAAEGSAVRKLEIGDPAPDFRLPGVDGKVHTLDEFSDSKLLCIVFTCNHCPTAQAYEERLKRLVKEYKAKGVAFVAISPNDPQAVRLNELGYTDLSDSFEEMKIRAEHRKFNFPYLYDGETQKVSKAYGPAATPHVFLFDGDRKLRYTGRIDDSEREKRVKKRDLKEALDALLAGREVPVAKTKTFGCSIKWSSKRDSVKVSLKPPRPESITLEPRDAEALKKLVSGRSDNLRLVNVWATWCGPCVAEFPEIVKTKRMYGHRSFEVVTISADRPDQKDAVLTFLRKKDADLENYQYSGEDTDKLIEAIDPEWSGALPHTLLVSPEGKVVYRHTGEIKVLELRRQIVKQLGPR